MKNPLITLIIFLLITKMAIGQTQSTRIEQFSNNQVKVWKTIIYPSTKQTLAMHRHEHNRIIVALTDGLLKITNDKGKIHYFKLEKDKAYYLKKDIQNELHKDENVSPYPIKVMVIELR